MAVYQSRELAQKARFSPFLPDLVLMIMYAGIPHEFYRSDLAHENLLDDERIPSLLQRLVDKVVDSGESLMNPLYPRL